MATPRRNLEDQESSIKSRANEVFSESVDSTPIKSFEEYLRTTPAATLSIELKALLWVIAFIIAILFAAALLRVQRGGRRQRPKQPPAVTSLARPQMLRSTPSATSLMLDNAGMDPYNRLRTPC